MATMPGRRSITSRLRKGVADQAEPALGMKPLAVEGDDAGRLLAAMLQGVQAERGDRGRIRMAENAEHAAFLAQPVGVQIEVEGGGSLVTEGSSWLVDHAGASARPVSFRRGRIPSRARRSRYRGCRA